MVFIVNMVWYVLISRSRCVKIEKGEIQKYFFIVQIKALLLMLILLGENGGVWCISLC